MTWMHWLCTGASQRLQRADEDLGEGEFGGPDEHRVVAEFAYSQPQVLAGGCEGDAVDTAADLGG